MNYIDGKWIEPERPSGRVVSTCPAQPDKVYWQADVSVVAVDHAIDAGRRAFATWRKRPLAERAALLARFKEGIDKHADKLALAIAEEAGKPLWEARTEIAALKTKIDVTLQDGARDIAPAVLDGNAGSIAHHALGVMAVLGPFNFPLSLSHGHIVPSLLAGNTIVLKPSEQTPGVAQLYTEVLHEAGFPPGVFNLVQGAGDVGEMLATHPGASGVLFTGSYAVGRALQLANIDQPHKILALEMGGKNATIVFSDANQKLALYETAFSAFVTCGQRCTATSRLILVDVNKQFTDTLIDIAKNLRIGDPLDQDTFMGPLISQRSRDSFHKRTSELGVPLLAPRTFERPGYFVSPHIVSAKEQTPELREEIFGPSLAIYQARDEAHAMALANDSPYGLALSVFTTDAARFQRCLDDSRCGLVNWNKGTVGATGRLPFGGIGKSGNFRPAGSYSMRYATYPVATVTGDALPASLPPGFPPLQ